MLEVTVVGCCPRTECCTVYPETLLVRTWSTTKSLCAHPDVPTKEETAHAVEGEVNHETGRRSLEKNVVVAQQCPRMPL